MCVQSLLSNVACVISRDIARGSWACRGIGVMLQDKISEKDMRIFYTTSAHVILMRQKLLMSKCYCVDQLYLPTQFDATKVSPHSTEGIVSDTRVHPNWLTV